jgi:hypothetical protein
MMLILPLPDSEFEYDPMLASIIVATTSKLI